MVRLILFQGSMNAMDRAQLQNVDIHQTIMMLASQLQSAMHITVLYALLISTAISKYTPLHHGLASVLMLEKNISNYKTRLSTIADWVKHVAFVFATVSIQPQNKSSRRRLRREERQSYYIRGHFHFFHHPTNAKYILFTGWVFQKQITLKHLQTSTASSHTGRKNQFFSREIIQFYQSSSRLDVFWCLRIMPHLMSYVTVYRD